MKMAETVSRPFAESTVQPTGGLDIRQVGSRDVDDGDNTCSGGTDQSRLQRIALACPNWSFTNPICWPCHATGAQRHRADRVLAPGNAGGEGGVDRAHSCTTVSQKATLVFSKGASDRRSGGRELAPLLALRRICSRDRAKPARKSRWSQRGKASIIALSRSGRRHNARAGDWR